MTDVVAFDEAHSLKNAKSLMHEACRAFQTELRIASTGTPLLNNHGELISMVDFVRPNFYDQAKLNRYLDPVADSIREDAPDHVVKETHSRADQFNKAMQFIVHRRTCLRDSLPFLRHYVLKIRLPPLQASMYNRYASEAQTTLSTEGVLSTIAPCLNMLYHPSFALNDETKPWFPEVQRGFKGEISWLDPVPEGGFTADWEGCSAKILAVKSIIEEAVRLEEKTLIFSEYPGILENLMSYLLSTGTCRSALMFSGHVTMDKRMNAVREFQEGMTDVLLMTYKVGSMGLTLTQASRVILLEPQWNMSYIQQAVGRCFRLGQTRPVYAYQLICDGTLEANIMLDKMMRKEWMNQRIVDDRTATREFFKKDPRSHSKFLEYIPTKPQEVDRTTLLTDSILQKLTEVKSHDAELLVRVTLQEEIFRQDEPEVDANASQVAKGNMENILRDFNPKNKGMNDFAGSEANNILRQKKNAKTAAEEAMLQRLRRGGTTVQSSSSRGGGGQFGFGGNRFSTNPGPPERQAPKINPLTPSFTLPKELPVAPQVAPLDPALPEMTRKFLSSNAEDEYVENVLNTIGGKFINVPEWVLKDVVIPKVSGTYGKEVWVDRILWGVIKAGVWKLETKLKAANVSRWTIMQMRDKNPKAFTSWYADVVQHGPENLKEVAELSLKLSEGFAIEPVSLVPLISECFPDFSDAMEPPHKGFSIALRSKLSRWFALPEWLQYITESLIDIHLYIFDHIFIWGFNEVFSAALRQYETRGTAILREFAKGLNIPIDTRVSYDGVLLKQAIILHLFPNAQQSLEQMI
eukprot:TRINITY_DN1408_c0_g1_i1.p1 TRINITY_DN1408_c0_g1~~TRINITY_DN1408_c0_g1_i1.p1  ORF type:complete len:947 (+),score=195.98 TRINITY_DN1408_c0_g1_i1:427-2841(+)